MQIILRIMRPLFTFFFLLISYLLLAQEPIWIQFEENEPYSGGGYEIGIDQYNNIYIGTAWSYPGWWDKGSSIIKYSSEGNKQWIYSKQVDTAGVMGMAVNKNGNCFVILNNRPWTPFAGIYGVDSDGNELYFNMENDVNYHGITCDSLGNAYITGHKYLSLSNADLIIIKYNVDGTKEWETNWTLPSDNAFGKKIFLDDQFLYVFGHLNHSNILVKFNLNGQLIDYTTFFEDTGYEYLFRSMSDIKMDDDKNIYLTGYNELECTGWKYGFIYKFDTALNEIWSDTLELFETAMYDINFDQNKNVILSGYDYDQHIASFAKYSIDGIKMWHYVYDSCISSGFSDAVSLNDKIYYTGSIYYEGTSGHKYVMYVTNQDGEYLSQHFYNGSDLSHSGGGDIVEDNFGNLICTGSYDDTGNICMTIKYDALTFEEEIIQNIPEFLKVYPNPARSNINIQLELNEFNSVEFRLYNLTGEIIKHQIINNLQPGLNTFSINTNGVSNGIYMLKCLANDKIFSQKVLITK